MPSDLEVLGIVSDRLSAAGILSKLVWARESASEMQRRDIALLLAQSPALEYIRLWAPRLGVGAILDGIKP
jgi:hypothetical protein